VAVRRRRVDGGFFTSVSAGSRSGFQGSAGRFLASALVRGPENKRIYFRNTNDICCKNQMDKSNKHSGTPGSLWSFSSVDRQAYLVNKISQLNEIG
jgi:hypothetical protein